MVELLYTAITILCAMLAYVLMYFKQEAKAQITYRYNEEQRLNKQIANLIKERNHLLNTYNSLDARYQQTQKALNRLSNEIHADIVSRDKQINTLQKTIADLTNKLIEAHNERYSKGLIC